jgi:hypothetical protein
MKAEGDILYMWQYVGGCIEVLTWSWVTNSLPTLILGFKKLLYSSS